MRCVESAIAAGSALALCAAACSSATTDSRPNMHHGSSAAVASPNFVPWLQNIGSVFQRLYAHSLPANRSTPFEVEGRIAVAEVDVPIGRPLEKYGSTVVKFTFNQLPSKTINPRRITSLDILRYNPVEPLAGFDLHFSLNQGDGTVDASCSSYQKPQGFSESLQRELFSADGNPIPGGRRLAGAFLAEMLHTAEQYENFSLQDNRLDRYTLTLQYENPCSVNFGF